MISYRLVSCHPMGTGPGPFMAAAPNQLWRQGDNDLGTSKSLLNHFTHQGYIHDKIIATLFNETTDL